DVEGEEAFAGYDILRPGTHLDLPHRADGVRDGGRDALERGDELRGGDERIFARAHDRCAGVVRAALHTHARVEDADDVAHHSERHAGPLEARSLLDVQLEVGRDLTLTAPRS